MIVLENVSLTYDSGTIFQKAAIKNVSLSIRKGESVSIVGKIGSGKSTLVQFFNGLIKPDSGKVFVGGEDLGSKETNLKSVRRKVGLVFQYPEEQFFAETVFDEVAFGPKNMGLSGKELKDAVWQSLSDMGFNPSDVANLSPFGLSGGEKRRIAIASIIAMNPEVLVLDEPTSGLDYTGRNLLIEYLKNENKKGRTLVFVTHNMDEALEVSRRVIAMKDGKKVFDGNSEDFFTSEELVYGIGLDVPFVVKVWKKLKKRFPELPFCRSSKELVDFLYGGPAR
ncbi:MAG: energy-coupling factor transporter ATPase [Caldisericaceae bacterium]|nr:energy-coupling factor transporter ATPase [Caldisericaceae bacterium]